ncbi:MAG: DNA translocase FtsK 4TM domain-containing protein, partial [Limnohabitans sp.]
MSYSLHTLNGTADAEPVSQGPRSLWGRFALEIGLLLGGAGLLLALLAMLSYSPADPAWSTSGSRALVHNWAGRLGAWVADLAFFALGFSAWWCWAAGLHAWLGGCSRWLRGAAWGGTDPRPPASGQRWLFWLGMVVLLASSCAIEWTRLYRWEAHLPGHSGGVPGHLLGPLAMHWLGFTGSALAGIVLMVLGMAMVFGFSWSGMAEAIGARIDALIQSRHAQREIQTDLALGQQALRERELTASPQPLEPVWQDQTEPGLEAGSALSAQLEIAPLPLPPHKPAPMVIEPGVTEVPRSERVAKERQKPLFLELPDSKLPQVDLLDALTARQETVSPETLEMTSRLIEKKLSDFGVQVRVVAAAPGPVITRYEIEPATGVKGSQIVNLAKDLARSLSLVSIR